MKGYQINNKLYVFPQEAGELPTIDSEVAVIYVQHEDLAAFKTANEAYADKMVGYNYNTMTVKAKEWAGHTDDDITSKAIENEVDMNLLKVAVSKLDKREKYIMELRFGIEGGNGKEKTQKEVADLLGISQSYISRLEKKIMNKMKKEITSKTG